MNAVIQYFQCDSNITTKLNIKVFKEFCKNLRKYHVNEMVKRILPVYTSDIPTLVETLSVLRSLIKGKSVKDHISVKSNWKWYHPTGNLNVVQCCERNFLPLSHLSGSQIILRSDFSPSFIFWIFQVSMPFVILPFARFFEAHLPTLSSSSNVHVLYFTFSFSLASHSLYSSLFQSTYFKLVSICPCEYFLSQAKK